MMNFMEVARDSVLFLINGVQSSDFVTNGLAVFSKTIKITHIVEFIYASVSSSAPAFHPRNHVNDLCKKCKIFIACFCFVKHAVAQLIEALCYKPEGR
jgi:hypothetical protein